MKDAIFEPASKIDVKEHLYDVKAHFTHVIDFGIKIQDLLKHPELMPPQGARYNFEFEGDIFGDRLNGKIKGIDYGYMRPDGYAKLHIHAVITTDTGANIDLTCEGITFRTEDPMIYNLRESIVLFTDDPDFKWVNQVQIWARGETNLNKGEITLSSFIA